MPKFSGETSSQKAGCSPLGKIQSFFESVVSFLGFSKIKKLPGGIQADSTRMMTDVNNITSIPQRYFHNPAGLDQAANYIRQEWENLGYEVKEQTYEVDGKTYRNLMISINPEKQDRVIVGAHYDVCSDEPSISNFNDCTFQERSNNRDKRIRYQTREDMVGADDNTSGVAGLLELSRLLKKCPDQINKGIDLVAFTLEEPPNFATPNMGSAQHAQMLNKQGQNIEGMIALEMIGYFDEKKETQKYPLPFMDKIFGNKGNYVGVMGNLPAFNWTQKIKKTMKKNSPMPVKSLNTPDFLGLDLSDHRNYSRLGIPAAMVTDTAFFRNPHYHQHTDTPETLHPEKMAQVINGVMGTLINL